MHHINQALRAHSLFQRDKDYIVRDDEVIIIDEFTGRMMQGRRYSEGLHQALEAKEHVQVQPENQTLASITFQNYFRMYDKLAGMTGTALTEADEFFDIYKLDVRRNPDQRAGGASRRGRRGLPHPDREIRRDPRRDRARQCAAQPVLVGTASIEKSEVLAEYLQEARLQADRFRQSESAMEKLYAAARDGQARQAVRGAERALPRAGSLYRRARPACPARSRSRPTWPAAAPTSSSAARWRCGSCTRPPTLPTRPRRPPRSSSIKADVERFREIVLKAEDVVEIEPAKGGKPAKTVTKPGGLYIIGTERHESRRIDNQLRGRSGRQGDPGPLQVLPVAGRRPDAHLRLRPARRHADAARPEGGRGHHPSLDQQGAGEGAAEGRGPQLRHPQEPAEVRRRQNDQRKVIFEQRVDLMKSESVAETVADMRHDFVDDVVAKHVPEHAYAEQWDVAGLKEELKRVLDLDLPVEEWAKEEGIADEELLTRIEQRVDEHMAAKVAQWGPDVMRYVEKTDPAADARPSLARASGDARPSAPGDRPARLRPARSAERIQVGSLQPVSRR